jgi:glycosyltransferase involved in cell wall biosynthesis
LAQSFDDFELWVIRDACTDDTETIVLEFSDPLPGMTHLPANTGNRFARNDHALVHARRHYPIRT